MTSSLYDYMAVIGSIYVIRLTVLLCYKAWRYFRNFVLAPRRPPAVDLRTFGSWAVVTGATDGIGKEYAIQLARVHRLNIVLISRSLDRLNSVAKEIESTTGMQTKCVAVDFTGGLEIYDTIKLAIAGLDIAILVNNVGTAIEYANYFCSDDDEESLRSCYGCINVNCSAATLLTRMVLPNMLAKRKGAVIFLSSLAGLYTAPLMANYSATKAYMDFFCRALNAEYKSKGIIFQVLTSGYVSTKLAKFPPTLLSPTTRDFVRSAMCLIGLESRTTGYFVHEFGKDILYCLPLPDPLKDALAFVCNKVQHNAGKRYVESLKVHEQKRQ